MFPRLNRLDLRLSSAIFQHSRRQRGQYVEILSNSQSKPEVELAVVVGKNTSLKATVRNRLKRQLRASLLSESSGLSHLALVIRPTRRALSATYAELKQEIHQLVTTLSH